MSPVEYDLIVGVGFACSCSESLRLARLQLLSFPYDWVTPRSRTPEDYALDLRARARHLCDGFAEWFLPGDFRYGGQIPENGKDIYFNDRLGLIFNHDFPTGVPFDRALPGVQRKYRRRADRLRRCILRAKRILLVRLDRPDLEVSTPVDDCRFLRNALSARFPNRRFDVLLFTHDPKTPVTDRRTVHHDEGLTQVTFDLRNPAPGALAYQADIQRVAGVLSGLCRVRDYRTLGERVRHWLAKRRKRHA